MPTDTLGLVSLLGVVSIMATYSLLLVVAGSRRPGTWPTILGWLLGLGIPTWLLLAPRMQNASSAIDAYVGEASNGALWSALLKYLAVAVLAICLLAVLSFIFSRSRLPSQGRTLWMGLLAFSIGPTLSSVLGAQKSFTYGLMFLPAISAVIFLYARAHSTRTLNMLKAILRIFILASLGAAIVAPHWAIQTTYAASVIPGVEFRLYGIAPHANALGPMALLYLIFEWLAPTRPHIWRVANVLAAAAVLLLAQSKTALAIALAVVVVVAVNGVVKERKRSVGHIVTATVLGILLVGLVGALPTLQDGLDPSRLEGLQTLTGRTSLWTATLETWRDYPIFGYGPSIWSREFRLQFGERFLFAGQAHNQFFQTLGEAGLLGMFGFAIYSLVLIAYGLRYAKHSRGGSLAVVTFMLLRTTTEASFRNYVLDPTLLMHLMCFWALIVIEIHAEGQPNQGTSRLHATLSRSHYVPQPSR